MGDISKDEIRQIAEAAAERAVQRVFLVLGVDIKESDDLFRLQRDLQTLNRWSGSVKQVHKMALGAAITTAVSGFLALVWLAFQVKLGR